MNVYAKWCKENGKQIPPPNPFYEKEFVCSLPEGHAKLTISAPGGVVPPDAAKGIREWLEIILRQVNRWENAVAVTEPHEQAESGKE